MENDIVEEYENSKTSVEETLDKFPECRNSDMRLIEREWAKKGFFIKIPSNCPPPETLTRARRDIQAQGKYLPTDPYVAHRRGINEEKMKAHFGESSITYAKFINLKYGVTDG
jgi:hypothetical protein